jgi:hypothetical protein
MTIFQKIQKIRVDLQEAGLTKSGENKHTKVRYFELGDFIPKVNELLSQNELMSQFSMDKKNAWVHITDGKEKVTFVVDRVSAVIQSATEIQSHGATITYLRRYLMMIAFEIVENDLVDSSAVIALEKGEIDGIMECKTVEELQKYCAGLKASKGINHQKVILKYYNERKTQIEQEAE